jgi:hypothetical protein
MLRKAVYIIIICFLSIGILFAQQISKDSSNYYKYSVSSPYLTFLNFGEEKTNTHHYEFHFGYILSPKDRIEIKIATWKLFAPMGIPLWDPLFQKESEFFPGRLRECGIGVTYQRRLWKGLFAQIEILPLWKTYLDKSNKKIDDGFKLYITYHLGCHISIFANRFYIEPQVHCNWWPIDSKAPQGFQEKEEKWKNYFLFEPNLYLGVKF